MEAAASWSDSTEAEITANLNLNSVAERSMDGSGIDMDCTIRKNDSFYESADIDVDETPFVTYSNPKTKNKRTIEVTSPEGVATKLIKFSDLSKVDNVIFMKGTNGNLAKQNPLRIKRALLEIDASLIRTIRLDTRKKV